MTRCCCKVEGEASPDSPLLPPLIQTLLSHRLGRELRRGQIVRSWAALKEVVNTCERLLEGKEDQTALGIKKSREETSCPSSSSWFSSFLSPVAQATGENEQPGQKECCSLYWNIRPHMKCQTLCLGLPKEHVARQCFSKCKMRICTQCGPEGTSNSPSSNTFIE